MKRWRWRLLALALFAGTLVLEFPAAALSRWAGWAGGEARGTWWRGSVAGVRWGQHSTAVLSWSLQPSALARGRLEFAVRLAGDGLLGSAVAAPSRGAMALRNVGLEFPAGGLAPSTATSLPGRIRISAASLMVRAGHAERFAGRFSWLPPARDPRTPSLGGTFVAELSRCRAVLDSRAIGAVPVGAFFGKRAARLPDGRWVLDWSGASQGAPATCGEAIRPRRRS